MPSSLTPGTRPERGHVHVWRQGRAVVDPDMLSYAERVRADGMVTPELRQRAVARRCFLRGLLGRYLAMPPAEIPLQIAPEGKPHLPNALGLAFSITHSGDRSLLAVSQHQVGIDLEVVRTLTDWAGLSRRVCSPREQREIAQSANPERAFMERWVTKEAVVKCRGTGLGDDLTRIDPEPLPYRYADGMTVLELDAGGDEIARLTMIGEVGAISIFKNDLREDLISVFGE